MCCLSGEKYLKCLLWTSLPYILHYTKFLKLTTLMDFRAMQIDFRYKSNLTWKTASLSSQCVRMGGKPGSAAEYNYSLSQNEVLVFLKGHQEVAAIKCSTKRGTSTSQSHMPSDFCVCAAPIFTILIWEKVNSKLFWGSWTNKHILPYLPQHIST